MHASINIDIHTSISNDTDLDIAGTTHGALNQEVECNALTVRPFGSVDGSSQATINQGVECYAHDIRPSGPSKQQGGSSIGFLARLSLACASALLGILLPPWWILSLVSSFFLLIS
jgi:hypothetical protein